jgi:hypothetical protein
MNPRIWRPKFVENSDGPLRVFELPVKGLSYTMGIDTATGLDEDYSVAQIFCNCLPFEQVAVLRLRVPVNDFTRMCNLLGRLYNTAFNVCEINYPGNSVQDQLNEFYEYPNSYRPEEHLDIDPNVSDKFGLRTTEPMKWLLINEFQLALANHEVILHDPVTISEFYNFVYVGSRRKASGAEGFTDDCVMSSLFAYHGAKLYPMIRPKPVVRKTPISPEARRMWSELKRDLQNRDKDQRRKGKIV